MADAARHIIHEIYSDVMFELAEETRQVDTVLEDLQAVAKLLRSEPEFMSILVSGKVQETEKVEMVRRVFGGRISPLTLDFLCVLARRNRVSFLGGIAGRYEDMFDTYRNRHRVHVTVAKPLSDQEAEKIRRDLMEAIQAEVKMTVKVDPEILGGIVIRKGDTVVDNSVRNILDRTVNAIVAHSKEKKNQENRKQE